MPVRLTAMTRSHSSWSRSRKLPPWLTPAQSSSTSSLPNSRTVAATAASTAERSRTSSAIAVARPPEAWIRAVVASAAAASMSAQATAAPSRAKPSAPAPPMPPPAPATSATFPSTRPIAFSRLVATGYMTCSRPLLSVAAATEGADARAQPTERQEPRLRHTEYCDAALRAVGVAAVGRQRHVDVVIGGARGYRMHGPGAVHDTARRRAGQQRDWRQRRQQLGQGVDHRPDDPEHRADRVVAGGHIVVTVARVIPDLVAAPDTRYRNQGIACAASSRVADRRLWSGNS